MIENENDKIRSVVQLTSMKLLEAGATIEQLSLALMETSIDLLRGEAGKNEEIKKLFLSIANGVAENIDDVAQDVVH